MAMEIPSSGCRAIIDKCRRPRCDLLPMTRRTGQQGTKSIKRPSTNGPALLYANCNDGSSGALQPALRSGRRKLLPIKRQPLPSQVGKTRALRSLAELDVVVLRIPLHQPQAFVTIDNEVPPYASGKRDFFLKFH